MRDNIFLTYMGMDFLFAAMGGVLIGFALICQADISKAPTANAGTMVLMKRLPLTAIIGDAVVVFITFAISIPAMVMPTARSWLKLHGYMTVICALFTMVVGLVIWLETLRARENLLPVWEKLPGTTQSLIQQQFKCCGYTNSTSPTLFQTDPQCPNAIVAASTQGCVSPWTSYANTYLDDVFTACFGIVGVDVALILTTAMLLKDRKEKERYRHIDEKNGARSI